MLLQLYGSIIMGNDLKNKKRDGELRRMLNMHLMTLHLWNGRICLMIAATKCYLLVLG